MIPPSFSRFSLVYSFASRWLRLFACLLILAGYFGPWVNHRSAGLVITGLDLGEYVKFLPVVRHGAVQVWREGFYWPLVAVSVTLSLNAYRSENRYAGWLRWGLVVVAIITALNLLPPAWTPDKLRNEFWLQSLAIAFCLLLAAFSPILALMPRWLASLFTLLAGIASLYWPTRDFLRVLPNITELYNRPVQLGWGLFVMCVGVLLLLLADVLEIRRLKD